MSEEQPLPPWRRALAVGLAVCVGAYTLALIFGLLAPDRRIDLNALAIIVLAAAGVALLAQPRLFDRVQSLEIGALKLQLHQLAAKQQSQERRLDSIDTLLPLVLPLPERRHMVNLARGNTADYVANNNLRAELRRLRSIQIIESLPNRTIGELSDGRAFDLSRHVKLTPLGEDWVKIIAEVEKAAAEPEPPPRP